LKVEIDIIASIAASPKGQAVIVVIMYVETFKTDVIVFIDDALGYLTSHLPIIVSIGVNSLILTISLCEIKGKMSKLQINQLQRTTSTVLVTVL